MPGAAPLGARAPNKKVFRAGFGVAPARSRSRMPAPYSLKQKTGPDRKLYLPGGLLDPSEVPAYLNGTLPGE
jgi:hypothetical protein